MAAYQRAVEQRAIEDLRPLLAEEVVLRSPLTDRVRFHGRDQVVAVAGAALGAIDGLRHVEETGDDRVRLLVSAGTVERIPIEETVVLRFDPDGRITGMTIAVRPLPALVALLRTIGPTLLRADGKPVAARFVRAALTGFAAVTRLVDRAAASVATSTGPA